MNRSHEEIFGNKKINDVAIIDSELNNITFSELYNSCVNLAMNLEKRQCSKNVVLYTGNAIEFAIGLIALWMTDRTAVMVEAKSNQEDIGNILEHFNSNTVIYSNLTQVEKVHAKNIILPIQLSEKQPHWEDKPFTNEIAIIFQTSGTTQYAKYVMLTHMGIIEECNEIIKSYGFGKGTRELLVVPITSSFGTCGILLPNLCAGGSVSLYQGEFNTAKLRRTIRDTKTTVIACTSSILELLVRTDIKDKEDFKSVEYIISAGEVSNIGIFDYAKKFLGAKNIVQAYGLTETSSQIAGSYLDFHVPYESVGKIMGNFTIRIKSGDEIKSVNELGEIQVKGNSVTCGYYRDSELNQQAFEEGWFKTGDIGYIDEEGYLYIKGRIKNIIIVGGKNVYAEEVEELLMKNRNIFSAHVYAEKSDVAGEKVIADIVFKDGFSMSQAELLEYCRNKMKPYMIPKNFKIQKERKINTSGKASRTAN